MAILKRIACGNNRDDEEKRILELCKFRGVS